MSPSKTMKQMFKKVIAKKQDKTKQADTKSSGFDPDSATLVNVPVRSGQISQGGDMETPVDISFIEDLVWGPAPSSYNGQSRSIFTRR